MENVRLTLYQTFCFDPGGKMCLQDATAGNKKKKSSGGIVFIIIIVLFFRSSRGGKCLKD